MKEELIRSCTCDVAKIWSDIVDEMKAGAGTSIEITKGRLSNDLRDDFLDQDEQRANDKILILFTVGLIKSNEYDNMKKEITNFFDEIRNRTTEIKED